MNKKLIIIGAWVLLVFGSCTKDQFASHYSDPSKISATTVESQYAGFLSASLSYNMYHYYAYFAVYQNTLIPWTQTAATINTNGRYIPGAAAINDYWSNYYAFLAQYKELRRLNSTLSAADQASKRIFVITATIYFYDYTQKMVDLFGDIPWSQAGLLGTNGGNYQASYAKYDGASTIYTTMLDSLKSYADELNTISISASEASLLKVQDFVNSGDVTKWKKYCNSLRLRILTRVNGVTAFQSRANTEIAAILANPTNYPLVTTYTDNISIKVKNNTTGSINDGTNTGTSSDFRTGLYGWGNADFGNKGMIDSMNNNADPRLRVMFGPALKGGYAGMDPSLSSTAQTAPAYDSTLSRYNPTVLTQNNFLPGMLINAAEVNFLLAEYYLNAGQDANAKAAYEAGITQSVNYLYYLKTITNDNTLTIANLGASEISNYLASNIAWSKATTTAQKLNLIAVQKWINYNVLQPVEAWSEYRRLKLPSLTFVADVASQTLPPSRWIYPSNESTYNATNYSAVSANDKLTTKIFWDVK